MILAAELSDNTTVAPERAVRIALQMARALASAHARGVVHRDLKPENVFLHRTEEGDEVVKIVDFGIAQLKGKDETENGTERRRRLTRTGMIFGTPEYMSPEQAAGLNVDLRADIYATGVMLYEMFTGAVPFTGTSFMAVLSAHLTQPIPPMRKYSPELDISAELEACVMRALEKNPDARFQSMRELASGLQQAPEGRNASPLAGLLPVPEVTISSFRPARGPGPATSPQFGKPDPLPFDLSREAVSERSNPRPSQPSSRGVSTLLTGTSGEAPWDEDTKSASLSLTTADKGRHKRAWILVGSVVVVAVGSAMFLYFQNQSRLAAAARIHTSTEVTPSVESASVVAARQVVPNGVATTSDLKSAHPAAPPNPPVVLTIQTNLPGATLSKDGFQVCDQTPCTIEVERGAAVELVAAKSGARGSAKVLAQKDQSVTINLAYPKSPAKSKDGGKPGLCEVTVDGLKILRPCQ
ncbi:MAG: serine/threonine-protein kinase [Polyangiaceae bacterium]